MQSITEYLSTKVKTKPSDIEPRNVFRKINKDDIYEGVSLSSVIDLIEEAGYKEIKYSGRLSDDLDVIKEFLKTNDTKSYIYIDSKYDRIYVYNTNNGSDVFMYFLFKNYGLDDVTKIIGNGSHTNVYNSNIEEIIEYLAND